MDDIDDLLSNLNLNSDNSANEVRDKYFKEIYDALSKNETTTKWINELGPNSEEELNVVFNALKTSTDDFFRRVLENTAVNIRYSIVEIIAKRCLQAEIKIQLKEYEKASSDALDIVKLINNHEAYFGDKEYMIGFRYVAKCLVIHGQLQQIQKNGESKKVNLSKLKELLEQLNEYQQFGTKQKVGVLAIKQYFAGSLRVGDHNFQIKIIRNIIKMDPDNLEWRCCLYLLLRYKRSLTTKYFSSPSVEEIEAIIEADAKDNAMFDARICLGYAFCLAEMLKSSGKVFAPITFGKKVFYSAYEVLQRIRAKVDDVLAIDPTSVRSNIDIAKIYSSILPYSYRDITFAKMCIKRALLFHPDSSKANHRMAALLISTNNPNAAIEYLEKAVENDERNIFATLDLLKVYMANIPTYKNKMERIFGNLTQKQGKKHDEVLILKAVYSFLNGNSEASVNLLVQAVKVNDKCIESLERIQGNFTRCNWGNYDSFSHNIKRILMERMASNAGAEKNILYTIWKSLKDGRDEFKSGHRNYQKDNSRNSSHGSSRSGGSSYDSGYKDNGGSGRSQANSVKGDLDCYAILGISRTATQSEIKKSYMKLAREHHPDKNMHLSEDQLLQKQELMKRINSAYDKLTP